MYFITWVIMFLCVSFVMCGLVPDSVTASHVVWNDAAFKGELGNLPIGNGDVAGNVWIEDATGDLLVYVAKSDAFDQNAQPVKVGRIRYTFDPPLWVKSDNDLANYTMVDNTIVCQDNGKRILNGTNVEWFPSSYENCPKEAATKCDSLDSCVSFSCTKVGHAQPMYQLAKVGLQNAVKNKGDWQFYYQEGESGFSQVLNLTYGSFNVHTKSGYSVKVLIDANAPVLRIEASHAKQAFNINATLEIYRNSIKQTNLGRGFCSKRYDIPDTVVKNPPSSLADGVVWYHRNDYSLVNESGGKDYYETTMSRHGVDPTVMNDPFADLTFGGHFSGTAGIKKVSDNTLVGKELQSAILEVTILTAQTKTPNDWFTKLSDIVDAQAKITHQAKTKAHEKWWIMFWNRSYITLPGRNKSADEKNIEEKYVWTRYLDACDGRDAASAMKFNGQAFTVDQGKGPDYRDWGACYWFQNTRQPYYNALAANDLDIMRPLFSFYMKSIDAIKARTKAEFNISGGYWPETMTQFGMYNPGDWGCHTSPSGPSSNTYIRFHTTGSLEMALFVLDDFTMTQDESVLKTNMPILTTVLDYYRTRYPNMDVENKMDMFPAQAIETYQCPNPSDRTKCVTNPTTDISGLIAVLSRAIKLPTSVVSDQQIQMWKKLLQTIPSIPISNSQIVAWDPRQKYAAGRHNSENTVLYPVHPFRIFGTGKPNLTVAQNTYSHRRSPCNDGWCQDVIDAAMLNLTDDAAKQVASRAGATSEFRWTGYAKHYQDYQPSLDHYGFMRTAMHYMLLSPLDDEKQSMLLFPTWPVDKWDIAFKLKAPLDTTIEAECIQGKLTKLIVTPTKRRSDITVLNCENNMKY